MIDWQYKHYRQKAHFESIQQNDFATNVNSFGDDKLIIIERTKDRGGKKYTKLFCWIGDRYEKYWRHS